MIREHENEPVPGLPERLPEGEVVLWRGAPDWRGVARHVCCTRLAVGWFLIVGAWRGIDAAEQGGGVLDALLAASSAAPALAIALGLLALLALAVAKTTVYTITNRRVAMRIGVALPLIVNIPFARIATARLKPAAAARRSDLGDIALEIAGNDRFAYWYLWPHARPWRLLRPEPMLRAVPGAAEAAAVLAQAMLAANPEGRVGDAVAPGQPSGAKATDRPATAHPVGLPAAAQ